MKKKASGKVKQDSLISLKNKASSRRPAPKDNGAAMKAQALKPSEDPRFAQAVQNYEAGLKHMQAHKFDRALALLEKVVSGPSRELADRAAVHLNTCRQQLARGESVSKFRSPEEHYDYAISMINSGDYIAAREHFDKLLKQYPQRDFVWYGAALLECLTGHYPESIRALGEAIRLNPSNRFQARNDSDFVSLADDPRFTELLYPEMDGDFSASNRSY